MASFFGNTSTLQAANGARTVMAATKVVKKAQSAAKSAAKGIGKRGNPGEGSEAILSSNIFLAQPDGRLRVGFT